MSLDSVVSTVICVLNQISGAPRLLEAQFFRPPMSAGKAEFPFAVTQTMPASIGILAARYSANINV